MKKLFVVSMIMALTLLAWGFWAPAQPQAPANEEKPTFYRLVPGTYVNGWPRFSITYPKDWVERHPPPIQIFRASAPGPIPYPTLMVTRPYPGIQSSLEVFASSVASGLRVMATDVTIVSDKPSRLRDGSLAQEIEINMILNGAPHNVIFVVTKKDNLWISMAVESENEKIGEDLKAILYSIQFQPGRVEPVKVPPDFQEFLDSLSNAWISHDLAKVMTHHSDKYLNSGVKKNEMEQYFRPVIGFVTSYEFGITDFIMAGDRAHVAGFSILNGEKWPLIPTSIIKEKGEWKWYGNQRNPAP